MINISLFLEKQKPLTKEMLPKLEEALGYQIYCPSEFWKRPDENRKFYDFYTDVLDDHNNRVIGIDWRWDPQDLFWYLGRLFPQHGFFLKSVKERNEDGKLEGYKVVYSYDEKEDQAYIELDEMHEFLDKLNHRIIEDDRLQLADLSDGDTYEYLLVKADFNEEYFYSLVSEDTHVHRTHIKIPSLQPHTKQAKKIFYFPIFENLKEQILIYNQNGTWNYRAWASRILPGETLELALKKDLKNEFKYTGKFVIVNIIYDDSLRDKKGVLTDRFKVMVKLLDELDTTQARPLGMKVEFRD